MIRFSILHAFGAVDEDWIIGVKLRLVYSGVGHCYALSALRVLWCGLETTVYLASGRGQDSAGL